MEREELRTAWMTLALLLVSIVALGLFVSWVIGRGRREDDFAMGCLRCSGCGVSWPAGKDYQPCPECPTRTDSLVDDPIDVAEARSRKNHADFERWLDENGRRDPVEQLERIPVKEEA